MKPESYHNGAPTFFVLRKTLTISYCNYVPGDLQVSQQQNTSKWKGGMKEGLYWLLISEQKKSGRETSATPNPLTSQDFGFEEISQSGQTEEGK